MRLSRELPFRRFSIWIRQKKGCARGIHAALLRRMEQGRDRAREFVNAIKVANPCVDCGEYFPAVCMDFDHLVAGEKELNVSVMVGRASSLKRIAREIEKCDLVCACCHRVRTRYRWDEAGFDIEEFN